LRLLQFPLDNHYPGFCKYHRLHWEDPANHGDIGTGAVDLSTSTDAGDNGATGDYAHAEGINTVASGYASHAQGIETIAQNDGMVAMGKYNVGTSATSIVEVGIGSSDSLRKNAFEIHEDGIVYLPSLEKSDIDNEPDDSKIVVTKEWVHEKINNIAFNDITDVEVSTAADGDIIIYDGSQNNWKNTDTIDFGLF